MSADLGSVFQTKYDEFANDLASTFPEFSAQIAAAKALGPEERLARFQAEVSASPTRNAASNPGTVLPGVTITDALWAEISDKTRSAIQEYLTLLTVCSLINGGKGLDGAFGPQAEEFLNSWKDRMSSVDFKGLAEKMAGLFGASADGIPKLPEKFLKGHLARLAEELVKDFNPADFGLDEETIKACEKDPSQAFNMLMKVYGSNPGMITGTIAKIGKRLQAKFASGQIRPQEIVAEAEELMKTFSDNPAFVEMMESFRSMFGMEDPDLARQAGREGSARLAMVKKRLQKKMAAKEAASAATTTPVSEAALEASAKAAAELLASEERNTIQRPNPKGKKK
jgi:hypothetical protein